MNCVRCGGAIELSQKHCGHCGVPLDADRNGVPDAVERLLEEKARAMVEEARLRERREQQEQREHEERTEREQREREQHEKLVRELTEAREALEKVRRSPRRTWALSRFGAGIIAFFTLIIGLPLTFAAGAISGRSLPGEVLCRTVCEGCSAPGRVFSWTTISGGGRSGHSRTLCTNPAVDVERIDWSEANDEALHTAYELPGWQEGLFAFAVWFLLGAAVLPVVYMRFERQGLAMEEGRLTELVASLERTLHATARPAPQQLYR
jgi:hypothetical protein